MATVKLDPAKGVQIPNMTTTERDAVSSPETGAIIWNTTTSAVNQYNGSAWKEVLRSDGSGAALTAIPAGNLTGTVADARISALTASKLTGALPALDGSALTGIDLASIRSDIATLALHSAVADNKAAYNLPSSFIDQFEDDTGIGTETTGDRNTTSEYWGTVIPGVGTNSNTKILLHMNDTSLSDSSGTSTTTTVTGMTRSSAQSKFGGYSALSDGSEYITLANVPTWQSSSTLFGIDFWWRPTSLTSSPAVQSFFNGVTDGKWLGFGWRSANSGLRIEIPSHATGWSAPGYTGFEGSKTNFAINTWYHIALVKTSTTNIKWYVDGVLDGTGTTAGNELSCTGQPRLGEWGGDQGWYIRGYIDEYRVQIGENPTAVSTDPLYISSGTSFTPPTSAYSTESVNATGTLISTAQTANAAQTKVSGVILYKNNAGTATLGTDLKIYFTCNGGTNWTESTPVAAGTFSTGILMAKCPEVTCTSGTDVRYKAVWANQALGSKETQLHGIAMNY